MSAASDLRDAIVTRALAIKAKSSSATVDQWAVEIVNLADQVPALVPPIAIVERRTLGADRRQKDDLMKTFSRRSSKRRTFQPPRTTHYINGIAITSPNPVNLETGGATAQIAWAFSYLPHTIDDVNINPPTETPTFVSSNVAVCTVSSAGVISPVGNGTATIALRVASGATTTLTAAVTTPIETVQSVVLSPASGTTQVSVNTLQLTATAYAGLNGTGNIIPGQTYTPNSSDTGKATVGQSGDTCTVTPVAAGSTNVKVTTSGVDSNLVAVTVAAAPGAATNEPVGFVRVAEAGMGFPANPNGSLNYAVAPNNGSIYGTWWHYTLGNLTASTNVAAPISPNVVSRIKFPAGLVHGNEPNAKFGISFGAQYRKLYERGAFLLEGSDWEHVGDGAVKMFGFWGVGTTLENDLYLCTDRWDDPMALVTEVPVRVAIQNVSSNGWPQNMNLATKVQVGVWHEYEVLMELNSGLGVADGTFKMWLDGVQLLNVTNMINRTATKSLGFRSRKMDQTWGGGTGTKTRDDYVQWDHIYISGEPI